MNLKEAFQMQKALRRLLEEAASYLDDTDNIMMVTEKHLRSKVVPEQADESVDCSEKSRMAYNPMTVLHAWHALMEEKERLGRAIVCRTHFPKRQPTHPAPSTRHLCAPKLTSRCSSRSPRAPSAKIPQNALSTSASAATQAVPSQRSSSCWRGSKSF